MINFHEKPSTILAWLNAKGYSGTLTDAMDKYIRNGSSLTGGTIGDQLMYRLGGTGTLNDRLANMFQTKTGISNYKEAERAFFQNSSLDMFTASGIAYISGTQAGSSNGTSVTTSAIDTTGADLIVILTSENGVAPAPTDSKSNTWTGLTASTNVFGANAKLWYCASPSVGSGHTFSLTSTVPSIGVLAFSGAAAAPFDVQNGGTADNTTSCATGSITPSQDNCLIIAGASNNGYASDTVDYTINSSMTLNAWVRNSGGLHDGAGIAYKIQTTAAAINPTFSGAAAAAWACRIASFKSA